MFPPEVEFCMYHLGLQEISLELSIPLLTTQLRREVPVG